MIKTFGRPDLFSSALEAAAEAMQRRNAATAASKRQVVIIADISSRSSYVAQEALQGAGALPIVFPSFLNDNRPTRRIPAACPSSAASCAGAAWPTDSSLRPALATRPIKIEHELSRGYTSRMTELTAWNDRYRDGNLPWDTGSPSSELQRVLSQHAIQPCRALDLGCGTGTNCVWLAQQGFDVTGIDVAPLAIERAEARARDAGVNPRFLAADILNLPDPDQPFLFFFDRGCYHAVRRSAPGAYAPAIAKQLAHGAIGLILAGNAREPHDPGPPVVTEEQIRDELGVAFQILDLHEFRFDEAPGVPARFLGWSCLVRKS